MRIALIGHGKMGKCIEDLAPSRGHEIVRIVKSSDDIAQLSPHEVDVAIEFTRPESAVTNLAKCIDSGIPVVSGTTGWTDQLEEIKALTHAKGASVLWASNFSLGVNILWNLADRLSDLIGKNDYRVGIEEWHHIHKKDAPSGTAITLAEHVIAHSPLVNDWHLSEEAVQDKGSIPIKDYREGEIPGTHRLTFRSEIDRITLEHEAFGREGFVLGSIIAAEWLHGKKGFFSMKDVLNLQ